MPSASPAPTGEPVPSDGSGPSDRPDASGRPRPSARPAPLSTHGGAAGPPGPSTQAGPSGVGLARVLAWGLFCALGAWHVACLALGADQVAAATKLTLMPSLFLAACLQVGPAIRSRGFWLLAAALWLSWLGDAAGQVTPFLPTLPAMLGFFALAHVAYIALFAKALAVRPLDPWAAWIPVWWVAMVALVAPHAGALAVGVGAYGVVLGATAAAARKGPRPAALGGVLFLLSDSLLAFWLFVPGAPGWLSPAVMATYCAGQGLLAWAASNGLVRRFSADA